MLNLFTLYRIHMMIVCKRILIVFSLSIISSISMADSLRETCSFRSFSNAEDNVIAAYIAYYGRPADPGGLTYWSDRLISEGTLNIIIQAFGESQEFERRFGSLSSAELVSNIYVQLFGRTPELEGLNFYVRNIEDGTITLQSASLNILFGAQNKDAIIINNRKNVAKYYISQLEVLNALSLEPSAEILATLIAGVTVDIATASSACDSIDSLIESTQLEVKVPNLSGLTETEAEARLNQAKLVLGTVQLLPTMTVPAGQVFDQDPGAGAKTALGSIVKIILSEEAPTEGSLKLPESWVGIWRIIFKYLNPDTGYVTLQHTTTNSICSGDTVGLTALNDDIFDCSASSVSDETLTVNCTAKFSRFLCSIEGTGEFTLTRNLSKLSGQGYWKVMVNEFCPGGSTELGELVEVYGESIGDAPGGCTPRYSSFSQHFVHHPKAVIGDQLQL